MVNNERIEEYLINGEFPYEVLNDGVWMVQDLADSLDNIVIAHTPPVLTFRVKLMTLDETVDRLALYERLLQLNSTMLAGAYGIEAGNIVIVDSLQSENLDFNEFSGTIEAIALSLREHYDELRKFISNNNDND